MNGVLALDLDATPRSSIQRSIDKIASYPGTIIHSPFAHFSTDALEGLWRTIADKDPETSTV